METEQKNLSSLIVEALRIKGISVEKLAQITGISERPIMMLIEEKLDKLPSAPYVHGYLMKIAEVLGLDGKKLWQEYLKDNAALRRSGKEDILPPNRFALPHWNKKFIWAGAIVAILIVYGAIKIISFNGQPNLSINAIPATVTQSNLTVTGQIDPQAQLTLDKEQIYPNKDGYFDKIISLSPGLNSLEFDIKKPLGKSFTIIKQVLYETTSTNTTSTQ